MRLRNVSLLLALCWMALLFYLSHQPSLPAPEWFAHQDKAFHAAAYAVLAALLLLALPPGGSGYTTRQSLASTGIASLYGVSDEIHQRFVDGRSADILDWLADTGGALIAALLIAWLSRLYFARVSQTAV